MAEEHIESKPDETPEKLVTTRLPDPLPPSEREVYEGKLKDLREEIERLKSDLAAALKPKKEPKRPSALERFSPL